MFLDATHEYDSSWSFGSFGFNFELQEPGNILEDLFSVHIVSINLEEIVLIDLFDLFDVEEVLMTVIVDEFVFLLDDLTLKYFLSRFEFLLTITKHFVTVHVDDDKCVGKYPCFLHG